MAYRPQHCTLVVQNTDGSGYLRQFETLAEAKAAYASISASGAAVSLYKPATSSLALFEKGGDAPEYDNGMTYGTGAVVKLNGRLYRLINFVGAGGYGPISHPYLWEDGRVPATGGPPPISNTNTQVVENGVARVPFNFTRAENATPLRMTKIGCEITQEREADGNMTSCSVTPRYRYTYPDGTILNEELGEKNSNGCWYPAGFKLSRRSVGESFREIKILNSLDFGGTMYGPYYQVDTYMGTVNSYDVSDGNGFAETQSFVSVQEREGSSYIEHYFQDGDTPYLLKDSGFQSGVWDSAGNPIPNGNYLVTYKVTGDERIHSGRWNVSIQNAGSSPRGKWVFTPESPDQPPPPPCSILRKVTNPVTGSVEDQCDPDVVYPYTVTEDCEPPLIVELEGTTVALGYNRKTGMNNGYGDVVWGECSGMVYVPYGILILSGLDKNYFSDGNGSYYEEDKEEPCPDDGSVISSDSTPIEVTINGATYNVGTHTDLTVADGTCGSRDDSSDSYVPNGTYLTEDSTYLYYSDGAGDYYTELVDDGGGDDCDPEGTFISEQTIVEATVEVCGSTVSLGSGDYATYADGSCGTYTTLTNNNFISSGTMVGTCAELDYFSDGVGGYYTQDNGSGDGGDQCEDSMLHNGEAGWTYDGCNWSYSEPNIVGYEGQEDFLTVSTLTVVNRTRVRPQYENGSVGEWTEWNYVPYGTFYGSDSEFNYYSDGAGSYYTECFSSGTVISSDGGTYYANAGCGEVSVGSWSSTLYADGNCGSYSESTGGYESNGTYITNCNDHNYYSDGMGSLYQGEYTGGTCDTAGTQLSSDGGTYYVNVGCGDWYVGDWGSTTYADGNCGSYTESGSYYVPNGTYLGGCIDYNYYSDGNGSYYQGEFTGTTYPTGQTGNTGSGTNYIEIDGTNYENGTYSYTEYHDGSGGYYNEYNYMYSNYGNEFTSILSGYDSELMMDIYTYYKSDGNGGYYTSN
jgi:hypothetical protein